jgi:hypothetical protein
MTEVSVYGTVILTLVESTLDTMAAYIFEHEWGNRDVGNSSWALVFMIALQPLLIAVCSWLFPSTQNNAYSCSCLTLAGFAVQCFFTWRIWTFATIHSTHKIKRLLRFLCVVMTFVRHSYLSDGHWLLYSWVLPHFLQHLSWHEWWALMKWEHAFSANNKSQLITAPVFPPWYRIILSVRFFPTICCLQ